jgi:hypothetical protein
VFSIKERRPMITPALRALRGLAADKIKTGPKSFAGFVRFHICENLRASAVQRKKFVIISAIRVKSRPLLSVQLRLHALMLNALILFLPVNSVSLVAISRLLSIVCVE